MKRKPKASPMSKAETSLRLLAKENEALKQEVRQLRSTLGVGVILRSGISGENAKDLSRDKLAAVDRFVSSRTNPGVNAPAFQFSDDPSMAELSRWSDLLFPKYILDDKYRIVDWNTAFSVAYERTMEGRRGVQVGEWIFFLENSESVAANGADFTNPEKLPYVHREQIVFKSKDYGTFQATKTAYRIADESGKARGWYVVLDPEFGDIDTEISFRRDVFSEVRREMIWSEYAFSYDKVLLHSPTYHLLLENMLGELLPPSGKGHYERIRGGSKVLDLGAGTGNLSLVMAAQDRGLRIVAVENSRTMIEYLRTKCAKHLVAGVGDPGIWPVRQDINSLHGIERGKYDYALMNNVAYSLVDPVASFKQVFECLTEGGEFRVSGPKKRTSLKVLFKSIRDDLKKCDRYEELQEDFQRVEDINSVLLAPMLYRWNVLDMKRMLLQAGFSRIAYETEAAYAGQAMIVVAQK